MHQGPPRLLAVASQQVDLELFCQEGSASEYCGPGAALRNLHSPVNRTGRKECYCLQQKISPQGYILYSVLQNKMLVFSLTFWGKKCY